MRGELRANHRRKLAKRDSRLNKWGSCPCSGVRVKGTTVDLETRVDDGSPSMKSVTITVEPCFRPGGGACVRRAKRRGWTRPVVVEEE